MVPSFLVIGQVPAIWGWLISIMAWAGERDDAIPAHATNMNLNLKGVNYERVFILRISNYCWLIIWDCALLCHFLMEESYVN